MLLLRFGFKLLILSFIQWDLSFVGCERWPNFYTFSVFFLHGESRRSGQSGSTKRKKCPKERTIWLWGEGGGISKQKFLQHPEVIKNKFLLDKLYIMHRFWTGKTATLFILGLELLPRPIFIFQPPPPTHPSPPFLKLEWSAPSAKLHGLRFRPWVADHPDKNCVLLVPAFVKTTSYLLTFMITSSSWMETLSQESSVTQLSAISGTSWLPFSRPNWAVICCSTVWLYKSTDWKSCLYQ